MTKHKEPEPEPETPAAGEIYMDIADVCELYHRTRTCLLKMVDRGEFPKALWISQRCVLFLRADVEAWKEDRWVRPGDLEARADAAANLIRRPFPRPRGAGSKRPARQRGCD